MTRVMLLTQPDCALCEHAKTILTRLTAEFALTVEELDLRSDQGRQLAANAGVLFAPGIFLDGQPFGYGRLSERKLRKTLARVADTPTA